MFCVSQREIIPINYFCVIFAIPDRICIVFFLLGRQFLLVLGIVNTVKSTNRKQTKKAMKTIASHQRHKSTRGQSVHGLTLVCFHSENCHSHWPQEMICSRKRRRTTERSSRLKANPIPLTDSRTARKRSTKLPRVDDISSGLSFLNFVNVSITTQLGRQRQH